jgi:hypothetical protein
MERLQWLTFPPNNVRAPIQIVIGVKDMLDCLGEALADPTVSQRPQDKTGLPNRAIRHVHLDMFTKEVSRAYRHRAHLNARYAVGHPQLCVKITVLCATQGEQNEFAVNIANMQICFNA